jgi:2-oxo-4-hydroxy-4-carboxy-5-ureidoimidazoline decarboxylase
MEPPTTGGSVHHTITEFDTMPEDDAMAVLLECCESLSWARSVAAARPYGSRSALLDDAGDAAGRLTGTDLDDALAGHPRIGERADNASSRREQAAVTTADADLLERIAAGNRAYEEKFGHVYLVRAAGRSASELLTILEHRLGNDPQTEQREVRCALADITRLRLERLITAIPEGTP